MRGGIDQGRDISREGGRREGEEDPERVGRRDRMREEPGKEAGYYNYTPVGLFNN